ATGKMKTFIIIAVAFFASSLADAVPVHSPFPQCGNYPFFPELNRNSGLRQSSNAIPQIGRIIEGQNLIWGESIGWVNLRTTRTDLTIGSNILAGWIWLENCGWICLGEGHPGKALRLCLVRSHGMDQLPHQSFAGVS
ncbi:MAG: hypothetical protein NTZ78_15330, partial [Candidatus Aureabacteria bacterium]|nr:hypothetical protein [Candidatus Auribacterota bacterium]